MSNRQATARDEAQALLMKVAPKGKITNGADAYLFDMRGPALMTELIAQVGRLREALQKLIDFDFECHCEHNNENCCELNNVFCPRCIASRALREAVSK
jgi:hypothetical protein